MSNVKMEMPFTADELWEAVFGANPEYLGSWWVSYRFLDDSDWDKAGAVSITLIDPIIDPDDWQEGDATVTKVLYPSDIVEALQTQVNRGGRFAEWFDIENYDSVAADIIIQTAMYGKIVFG